MTRLLGAIATALALGVCAASPASAAYEQVDNFAGTPGVLKSLDGTLTEVSERWPEEVQLSGVGGMAVNRSGAGGVPAGTLYAATTYDFDLDAVRVARFNPDGSFSENWTFTENPLDGRLRTTFEATPDAPVKSATFALRGGRKGLFVNSTNLCKGTHRAEASFTGHNGKRQESSPALLAAGCARNRAKGKQKRRAG